MSGTSHPGERGRVQQNFKTPNWAQCAWRGKLISLQAGSSHLILGQTRPRGSKNAKDKMRPIWAQIDARSVLAKSVATYIHHCHNFVILTWLTENKWSNWNTGRDILPTGETICWSLEVNSGSVNQNDGGIVSVNYCICWSIYKCHIFQQWW